MGFWQRHLWLPSSSPALHWHQDPSICSDLKAEGVPPFLLPDEDGAVRLSLLLESLEEMTVTGKRAMLS